MASHFIVGLDIGTAAIKVAVAERRDGRLTLRSLFKEPTSGLRRGVIVDVADVSQALARAFGEVKKISKSALKCIYASIGTHQVKTQTSRGIVAVSRADTEIYQEDIDRVVRASHAITLSPNRAVVHHIPREFIVDGVGDILDPLGLNGSRLEVTSFVIDAFVPHVKYLMRVIELNGGEVRELVLGPLVSSRSALSKRQKELGTVLVDIGAGTTGMAVYEENKLLGASVFPVGAGSITSDIAVGLKIPVDVAEQIKLHYGYAVAKDIGQRESIEMKKFLPEGRGLVARRFLAEVIEARLAEVFEFVNNELKLLGKSGQLPGGVVLVGGGAKLPGITELVRAELKLSSQIGLGFSEAWGAAQDTFTESLEDPEYVTALGLVLWGLDKETRDAGGAFTGFSLKKLMRYFLT